FANNGLADYRYTQWGHGYQAEDPTRSGSVRSCPDRQLRGAESGGAGSRAVRDDHWVRVWGWIDGEFRRGHYGLEPDGYVRNPTHGDTDHRHRRGVGGPRCNRDEL